jgi:cbb3-type cytochrome oxidase subunit 3
MSSGFITNYIQQSDGTFDGTLNTLDPSGNTTTIHLSNVDLIKNEWCFSSPNNIDQILVMTNDSKYIYVPSTSFMISQNSNTLYKSLINICISLYEIRLTDNNSNVNAIDASISVPISNNLPKSLKNAAQLAMYMYLYFFINNGIGSYIATNKISTMFKNKTFTLDQNDPNYNTWNKLPADTNLSAIIKQIFLMYAICMNYKNYMHILDFSGTLSTNLTDSNWQYVGNFFKTIYDLYFFDASNFCINLTGNIEHITSISSPSSSPSTSIFSFSSPSSTILYIPECVDCRTVSLNANTNINTKSLCTKPSVNADITYTPAQITEMNDTFLSTTCLIIIILIIIAVLYWYFNRNNESNINESSVNKNDYYYI